MAESEAALSEMKNRLLGVEQDFLVIKSRRDQARLESDTLDLLATATVEQGSATSEVVRNVKRLEEQVGWLEARNDARRQMASLDQRASKSKLARSFHRLAALQQFADDDSASHRQNRPAAEEVAEHSETAGSAPQ